MKRLLWVVLVLACIGLSGCALFGSRQKGNASAQNPMNGGEFPQSPQGTNQVTATITSSGGVTTIVSGGKVTTVAGGGQGGSVGPEGAGVGAATAGHGPLFYFYVLFAAAIVIWVIWAIWHSYRRRHGYSRVHYRRRRPA
jgi:hypothetical protein